MAVLAVDGRAKRHERRLDLLHQLRIAGAQPGLVGLEVVEVRGDQLPARAIPVAVAGERDRLLHGAPRLRQALRMRLRVLGEGAGANRRERLFLLGRSKAGRGEPDAELVIGQGGQVAVAGRDERRPRQLQSTGRRARMRQGEQVERHVPAVLVGEAGIEGRHRRLGNSVRPGAEDALRGERADLGPEIRRLRFQVQRRVGSPVRAVAGGARLRVHLRAVAEVGRALRDEHHVETLDDLVPDRARRPGHLGRRSAPFHAEGERVEPLGQVFAPSVHVGAQLARRVLHEADLLRVLRFREHLAVLAHRAGVVVGDVVEQRHHAAERSALARLRPHRRRGETETENHSQHVRLE